MYTETQYNIQMSTFNQSTHSVLICVIQKQKKIQPRNEKLLLSKSFFTSPPPPQKKKNQKKIERLRKYQFVYLILNTNNVTGI